MEEIILNKNGKIWAGIIDGDANLSGRTRMNSKTQVHKLLLFMYRNFE